MLPPPNPISNKHHIHALLSACRATFHSYPHLADVDVQAVPRQVFHHSPPPRPRIRLHVHALSHTSRALSSYAPIGRTDTPLLQTKTRCFVLESRQHARDPVIAPTRLACMCDTCIHTCMHACMHTHIHTFIHSFLHSFLHSFIRSFLHACMHTHMHTYMHTYMHPYMHIHTHTHTHKHIYIYIHMHIYVHMHTCTLYPSYLGRG